MRLLGIEIAIEVMGARQVVLLGIASEVMGVSFVKLYFPKGLLQLSRYQKGCPSRSYH